MTSLPDSVLVNVASLAPTLNFRACSDGNCGQTIFIEDGAVADLVWSTTNATSCTASGNWSGPKLASNTPITESTGPLNGPAIFSYTLTCSGPGGSTPPSNVVISVNAPPAIFGDVFSLGRIQNLSVSGPAVVSAGVGAPIVSQCGTNVYCISGYPVSLTNDWRNVMNSNLDRLLAERARTWTGNMSVNRFGGEIWRHDTGGTLSLSGTFVRSGSTGYGRGTLIATNADISITGDLRADEPVGIVMRRSGGTITIGPGVQTIRNIYFYAPNGTIRFSDDPSILRADGAFIANSFIFPPRRLDIRYSTYVALNPPPGFVSFILPSVLERAP